VRGVSGVDFEGAWLDYSWRGCGLSAGSGGVNGCSFDKIFRFFLETISLTAGRDMIFFCAGNARRGGCIKKRLSWLAAAAVFLACTTQCSQGKPDFTGTWVQVGGPPTPGVPYDPDLESRMMIKQDGAKTMSESVTVTSKSKPSVKSTLGASTFKLDGSERRSNPSTVSKTYWEGNTLVFKNTEFREGKIVSTHTIVWSLDHNGMLVVENTLTTPNQPRPAKMRTILKKVAP
jgi:hypothetical protein